MIKIQIYATLLPSNLKTQSKSFSMIKRYITLCTIMMSYMASAADAPHTKNFQAPMTLHHDDRVTLFNWMSFKGGINPSNIIGAALWKNKGEHKNVANDAMMVHALFHPFNWHNAKLVAPLMALFGAAAYAARKSPLFSVACGLAGIHRMWNTRNHLQDLFNTCRAYREDAFHIKEDAQLHQLSRWNRYWVRSSNKAMTIDAFDHIPKDTHFPHGTNWMLLYWGKEYIECYRQKLDNWNKEQLPSVLVSMRYKETTINDIHIPITHDPAAVDDTDSDEDGVLYQHIHDAAMVRFPQVHTAYEQGKKLCFKGKLSDMILVDLVKPFYTIADLCTVCPQRSIKIEDVA